jgi:MFS family permease
MAPPLSFSHLQSRWYYALIPHRAGEGILSIVFPLFLLHIIQVQVGTVGVLSGLISCTAMVGAMFWGYMSDRYRLHRSIMVLGCLLSGLCLIGMGFADSLSQLIIWCFIYGFFSIAPAPISSVLIMETLPKSLWDSAFGVFNKIGGWGWVVGLLLGLWLLPLLQHWLSSDFSLRLALWGSAGLTIASAWWLVRTIPAPGKRVQRQQFITVTHRLPRLTMIERVLYVPRRLLFVLHPRHLYQFRELRQRPLQRYYLASAIMFCGFLMVLTPFPLFLHDTLKMDTSLIFILMLVRSLAAIPCYGWAGRWTQRVGPQRLLIWMLVARSVSFCGLASLAWMSDYTLLLVSLLSLNMLIGMTWSVVAIAGPVLVGQLTIPGSQGEAMGLYNAIQGVAQILGAVVGGYLAQWIGYYGVFIIGAAFLLLAIGLFRPIRLQDIAMTDSDPQVPPAAAPQAA